MKGVNGEVDPIRKLVSRRLRAQVPDAHPEPNLLTGLMENALPRAERDRLLDHLAACSSCREILYLAIPDPAEVDRVLQFAPRRQPRFVAGWGTLLASLSIIALVVFGAHERRVIPEAQVASRSQSGPAASFEIAKEMAPEESSEMRDRGPRQETARLTASKRPEPKHMTARPQTAMQFDELSGQVRLQPPPEAQPYRSESRSALPASPAKAAPAANARVSGSPETKRVGVLNNREAGSAGTLVSAQGNDNFEAQSVKGKSAEKVVTVEANAESTDVNSATSAVRPRPQLEWTLSPEGVLERSSDAGKNWQTVSVPGAIFFRALASVGMHVWLGGPKGALYHSADSGESWVQLRPSSAGRTLEEDITRIDFSDVRDGTLSTADGAVWKTSDGGQSWHR